MTNEDRFLQIGFVLIAIATIGAVIWAWIGT